MKYADIEGTPDGLATLVAKAGADTKAKTLVRGKGGPLVLPGLPLPLPLRVQVQSDGGLCQEAIFSAAGVRRNDDTTFVGTSE